MVEGLNFFAEVGQLWVDVGASLFSEHVLIDSDLVVFFALDVHVGVHALQPVVHVAQSVLIQNITCLKAVRVGIILIVIAMPMRICGVF
jgi:hypothetical protein